MIFSLKPMSVVFDPSTGSSGYPCTGTGGEAGREGQLKSGERIVMVSQLNGKMDFGI